MRRLWSQKRGRNIHLQKAKNFLYSLHISIPKLRTGGLHLLTEYTVIRFLLSHMFSLRLIVVALGLMAAFWSAPRPLTDSIDHALFQTFWDLPANDTDTAVPFPGPDFNHYLETHDLHQPSWVSLLRDGLLAGSVLLLTLGVPALGSGMAVLLVGLIGAALVVGQAIMLLYQKTWMPLGEVYAVLIAGFVIMLFWMQQHREIRDLRHNVLNARYQLGRVLLQQGQPNEALEALAECPPSQHTLELQYDIAIQQERKRQYEAAIHTYEQIMSQRKGFRDVKNRLQALEKINVGSTGTTPPTVYDATSTLVLPDPSVSKPTLGRYEIEREIGRGAMGVVYLGQDPKIARKVAIKTFSYAQFEGAELKELKSRFYREAEAAGRLNHPAIVTVYDVGEEADLAYIAMDYAEGKSLSAHGRRDRLLKLPVVLDVLAQVAEALDYAHRQKIVHRDIKPANIIYDARSGDVKITDFGIAKIADDSRTRTGSVMGSPLYMSPEQLKGQRIAGTSDVYSLGVTLYKLVSGETPFNADTLANLTYQILNKRPRSVREFNPDLPDGVVRLINKAIQRDPSKRFASAGAMAEALRRAAVREGSKEAS